MVAGAPAMLVVVSTVSSMAGLRVAVLSVIAVLAALTSIAAQDTEKWWQHAVIYQIYPRSFVDSNGDGVGDLIGITSQLKYLADLGVGAVWLSPIYPSPQKDFGYDISDYKSIDPQYGTMDDFKTFVTEAHNQGLKVVLDIVPNHSSNEHDWFKKSEAGDADYKDYYVWNDGDKTNIDPTTKRPGVPNNWLSEFRFSAWEWSDTRQAYYLHQFLKEQPDLNYRNAKVVQEMKDVYTFWMNNGVDGFRVDAVPFLFEDEQLRSEPKSNDPTANSEDPGYLNHIYTQNLDGTYDMVEQWRSVIDGHTTPKADRMMMTECYSPVDKLFQYYGTPEKPGATFPFNFALLSDLSESSLATDFKKVIDNFMSEMNDDVRWPNWVLGNHDNHRVATRYQGMADSMNMISLTLPGTAMTYNGEEIGMTDAFISWAQTMDPSAKSNGEDNYLKTSRDPERTPFQWDGSVSAGFSKNATTWLPTNPNYWELNVENQKKSSTSHLQVYKDLLAIRKTDTLKGTKNVATDVINDSILKIERSSSGKDTYVTLVNIGSQVETISANDIGVSGASNLKVYTKSDNFDGLSKGSTVGNGLTLRPKAGVVLTTAAVGSATQQVASIGLVLLSVLLRALN